ncbi:MFS transporter [Curtobacterium sp. BRD11]|uniref:MFS transporter n=1 Tax=Curtobacterium sp. BRD11 TaxID=2962581 RepID=UPI002881A2E1|nr:MFS transporter [Curtobacterium sp. BRD11]MDT0212076.1 hypothetical protein [Curtobacterium sp. BRD11]
MNNRSFWLVFGECASVLGNAATSLAIPVVAAGYLKLPASELAFLSSASWIPWLFAIAVAHASRRWSARLILTVANAMSALALFTTALLVENGRSSFYSLAAASLMLGASTVAYKAAFPRLVRDSFRPERIAALNRALFGGAAVAQATALVAGPFVLIIGEPWILFTIDASTFVVALVIIWAVCKPHPQIARSIGVEPWGVKASILEVNRRSVLLRLTGYTALTNMCIGGYSSLAVTLFSPTSSAGGSVEDNAWLAVAQIGSALGGFLYSLFVKVLDTRLSNERIYAICGVLILVLPLATAGANSLFAFLAFFGSGVFSANLTVRKAIYLSREIPAPKITHVSAITQLTTNGAYLVGTLLAAAFATIIEARVIIAVSSAALTVISLCYAITDRRAGRSSSTL